MGMEPATGQEGGSERNRGGEECPRPRHLIGPRPREGVRRSGSLGGCVGGGAVPRVRPALGDTSCRRSLSRPCCVRSARLSSIGCVVFARLRATWLIEMLQVEQGPREGKSSALGGCTTPDSEADIPRRVSGNKPTEKVTGQGVPGSWNGRC